MNPLFLPAERACLLFTMALRKQLHLVVAFISVSRGFGFACTVYIAQESVVLVRLYSVPVLAFALPLARMKEGPLQPG